MFFRPPSSWTWPCDILRPMWCKGMWCSVWELPFCSYLLSLPPGYNAAVLLRRWAWGHDVGQCSAPGLLMRRVDMPAHIAYVDSDVWDGLVYVFFEKLWLKFSVTCNQNEKYPKWNCSQDLLFSVSKIVIELTFHLEPTSFALFCEQSIC